MGCCGPRKALHSKFDQHIVGSCWTFQVGFLVGICLQPRDAAISFLIVLQGWKICHCGQLWRRGPHSQVPTKVMFQFRFKIWASLLIVDPPKDSVPQQVECFLKIEEHMWKGFRCGKVVVTCLRLPNLAPAASLPANGETFSWAAQGGLVSWSWAKAKCGIRTLCC